LPTLRRNRAPVPSATTTHAPVGIFFIAISSVAEPEQPCAALQG
jgi:hypothetical protein